MTIRHILGVAALSALLLTPTFMAACAPVHVQSFTDRGTHLTTARTYRWADDGARATGDPRLDGNPFFERRLMSATEQALAAKGFESTTSETADLVLHYHASVGQRLDVSAFDSMFGLCEGCDTQSIYDAGTILLDFVDARSNTLVWRAWAEGSIDGLIDSQEWLEQHIDDAIKRIVATLPKRS